jgi:hypothetical protein
VTQVVAAGPAAQTITFTSTAPTPVVGGSYTPTATGGASGQSIVFGVTGTNCTITGGVITFTHTGTCTVTADQSGNPDYTSAPQVTQVVAAGPAAQTITFTSPPPTATAVTGVGYPVAATSTSGLPVTLTGTGRCTVTSTGSGTATVTLSGTGSCTVTATQVGNPDFSVAPPVTQTYSSTPGAQADLRVTVARSPATQAPGAQTLTVTVTNTGPRDSGATRTQLFTTLPVTNPGTATTAPALFGTQLTWTTPNIPAGQTATYTVTTNPGFSFFFANTQGATPDPNPFNNLTFGF